MRYGAKLGRYLVLAMAGLALAGCSGWSFAPPMQGNFVVEPWNLSAINGAAPAPGSSPNFTVALASDYSSLATAMDGPLHDYAGADYFARKGLAASRGEVVPPENNSNWLIPLEVPLHYRTMLADARTRLVTVLDGGARDRAPALAAMAQVNYDCWVERMQMEWWNALAGKCHTDFEAEMAQLEGKQPAPVAAVPAQAHRYNVYFEFDKSSLTSEGRQIVGAVANAAKADTGVTILLVGKADTVGTDAYNMGLSHRRADTVRAALQASGITPNRVQERWVGLREPPVPTPPGVREPRNRVVEINLQ